MLRKIFQSVLLSALLIGSAQAAPEYTQLDGQPVQLSDYQGRYLLVNYWATWCPPCVKEMPSMQRLHEALKDESFSVIAVNVGQSAEQVKAFRTQLPVELKFPMLLDEQSTSFSAMQLVGLPTSYLLSPQGERLVTYTGGREWDSAEQIAELRQQMRTE